MPPCFPRPDGRTAPHQTLAETIAAAWPDGLIASPAQPDYPADLIARARTELRVAVVQMAPGDDPIICARVRRALALLEMVG